MFDRLLIRWEGIPGIYPLFVFTIILIISFYNMWDIFPIMFMITGMQLMFWFWQLSRNYNRKMDALGVEPEDDPTGNSNIKKKLYDHM